MADVVDAQAALCEHMERKGIKDFDLRNNSRMQHVIADGVLLEYLGALIPFADWVALVSGPGLAGQPPVRPRPGDEALWLPCWKRETIVFPRDQGTVDLRCNPSELSELVSAVYLAWQSNQKQRFQSSCEAFLAAWRALTISVQLVPVGSSKRKNLFRHACAYSLALYFGDLRVGPTTLALIMASLGRDDKIFVHAGHTGASAIAARAENYKKLWGEHSRQARRAHERFVQLPAPPARNNKSILGPIRSLSTASWLAYRPSEVSGKASVRLARRRNDHYLYADWRDERGAQTRYCGPAAQQNAGMSRE